MVYAAKQRARLVVRVANQRVDNRRILTRAGCACMYLVIFVMQALTLGARVVYAKPAIIVGSRRIKLFAACTIHQACFYVI